MGNDGEIFSLSDGSLWEVKNEYEYLYEYYPSVIICPNQGTLSISGTKLSIEPAGSAGNFNSTHSSSNNVIESKIEGEFSGWASDAIFKLTNGQIWQQTDVNYEYQYQHNPKAIIIPRKNHHEIIVDGMDEAVKVVRLR